MAKTYYTDVYISVAGTDLSDHVIGAEFEHGNEAEDGTAMGATNRYDLAGGLDTYKLDVEFFQDFATSSVDDLLDAAIGVSTAVVLKPTGSGPSANNPQWSGNFILRSYQPCSGSVGGRATTRASFTPAGTISRAVSA